MSHRGSSKNALLEALCLKAGTSERDDDGFVCRHRFINLGFNEQGPVPEDSPEFEEATRKLVTFCDVRDAFPELAQVAPHICLMVMSLQNFSV